ncbi:ABC transporter ATP-binding protein [Aliidongia dinghuensis]|uniref:ABC transporter ATP-binding protein n=1 Tax=Aliidongia dinghuensis TaxID=1867774 RepID=A0A8J2YT30_9PROT|nr:ABC transporter ATP-binding protein [Aliidongia dinghuensis]GGF14125.1 ABC transporter ATP-binding protein [Aliidongia dinghuensis]
MPALILDRLTKLYGTHAAVESLSLTVDDGEFLVLLGPSGCGKTTTLRMIAGFVEASDGRVSLGGRDITQEPPHRRNIGVVFQNYALFPHLSVFENVAFGLRRRKRPEAEIKERVTRALGLVRLESFAERMPKQMSGGQQQRVAIARALVIEPDILLLDEPLSALDAKLRHEVRQELKALQRLLGIATILVTHDQDEAMSLGDRLVVMNAGKVEQIGTPQALYRRPASRFVAGFIGRGNFLEGSGQGRQFTTNNGWTLEAERSFDGVQTLMLRPEALAMAAAAGPGRVPARVSLVTYLGPIAEVALDLPGGDRLLVEQASGGWLDRTAPGQDVWVEIPPDAIIGLDADGLARA